ncbi:MAG TPA: hypothetical protein VHW23_25550 [Kofleriaceae bacterium]|jgi:hypothetical protein|nr:hypothetical protein [Kofleriaceae bacterium]
MADNREKRADWLKDVAAVNAWVKAQPWCDVERVVVFADDARAAYKRVTPENGEPLSSYDLAQKRLAAMARR